MAKPGLATHDPPPRGRASRQGERRRVRTRRRCCFAARARRRPRRLILARPDARQLGTRRETASRSRLQRPRAPREQDRRRRSHPRRPRASMHREHGTTTKRRRAPRRRPPTNMSRRSRRAVRRKIEGFLPLEDFFDQRVEVTGPGSSWPVDPSPLVCLQSVTKRNPCRREHAGRRKSRATFSARASQIGLRLDLRRGHDGAPDGADGGVRDGRRALQPPPPAPGAERASGCRTTWICAAGPVMDAELAAMPADGAAGRAQARRRRRSSATSPVAGLLLDGGVAAPTARVGRGARVGTESVPVVCDLVSEFERLGAGAFGRTPAPSSAAGGDAASRI